MIPLRGSLRMKANGPNLFVKTNRYDFPFQLLHPDQSYRPSSQGNATNHNTHQERNEWGPLLAVESLGNCTTGVHVKSFIVHHHHQSQQYKVQSINHSNRITITVDRSLTRSCIFCWVWVDPGTSIRNGDMNCVSKLFFRLLLFRLHFICLAMEWIELKCNRRVANRTYRNGLAVDVDEEDVHEWFWYDSDDDQNSARPAPDERVALLSVSRTVQRNQQFVNYIPLALQFIVAAAKRVDILNA